MPLAVVKRTVGELPLELRLDDSMAMMPQLKLSQFDRVVVGARVSFSGDPIAQPGDLFGEIQGIALPTDQPVQITIADTVQPRAQ
jgi:cytochrome c-type biogenesis protein CcmH